MPRTANSAMPSSSQSQSTSVLGEVLEDKFMDPENGILKRFLESEAFHTAIRSAVNEEFQARVESQARTAASFHADCSMLASLVDAMEPRGSVRRSEP